MLQGRVDAARVFLDKFDADHLLFLNLANIRYLCGFSGSDGALVIGREKNFFLTDSRYTTQAGLEVWGCEIIEYRGKLDGLKSLLKDRCARKVGFESEFVTVATRNGIAEGLADVELVAIGEELSTLRLVKDAGEIDMLERAATIASTALQSVLGELRPGMVEREIALELEFAMRRAGADDKSFDFIVASGERGALPHGRASEKQIAAGELITFDFGALYQGYHSDETVTVMLGQPDQKQREIYGIVREAQSRAIAAVKPGVALRELDAIARGFIEEKGYGSFFGHGLGHGVGLDVHEKPVVSFRGEGVVAEGMVFTIEPGIYLPGWGGVRIEDTLVATEDGCRLLTKVPKELIVV